MAINRRLLVAGLLTLGVSGCGGPPDYVDLTAEKRKRLLALRKSDKFRPEESPERSYPGPDNDKTKADLNKIIDDVIDAILAQPNGRVDGSMVRDLFWTAMNRLNDYPPDDGHRGIDYMIDVWRIMGFRTKTGILGETEDKNGDVMSFGWILQQIMEKFSGGSTKH